MSRGAVKDLCDPDLLICPAAAQKLYGVYMGFTELNTEKNYIGKSIHSIVK